MEYPQNFSLQRLHPHLTRKASPMNIKQKLILAFAVIASLPVILVAVLIILNVHEVLHRSRP